MNNYDNKDDNRTMPDAVKIINDYNVAALIHISIKIFIDNENIFNQIKITY